MCARLHAECASTPPSDARSDFPPGAYAPVPPVTSRKTRLRSDCSSSLNAWQFSMPLCADRVRPADIGVARLEVVARRAPHHQRDPLPVLLEDESHRVAAGMGLAHVVVLALKFLE